MTTTVLKLQKVAKTKLETMDVPYINWKTVCLIGFFMMFFLLVFYVWQVNDLTKVSFTINSYQNKISNLSQQNRNLEVGFATASFLGQAEARAQALNFQKVTAVKYIQVSNNSVVSANIKN